MNYIVDAVVVIYNPHVETLLSLIASIAAQVRCVYMVNNGADVDVNIFNEENIRIFNLGDNYGVAYAQNIGLKASLNASSDFVLISDQDTLYPRDFVVKALDDRISTIPSIAAIVPLFIDQISDSNVGGFYKSTMWGAREVEPIDTYSDVSQAISSGMIVRASALEVIGLMNVELFIDWVDFEWCWRARSKGFRIVGNADVVIVHQLGDESVNIGFRGVNLRSPTRHYYITRNAFYLSLYSDVLRLPHKIGLFFSSMRYIVGFPLLSKPHIKNLKAVLLGLCHGLTGRLGRGGPL